MKTDDKLDLSTALAPREVTPANVNRTVDALEANTMELAQIARDAMTQRDALAYAAVRAEEYLQRVVATWPASEEAKAVRAALITAIHAAGLHTLSDQVRS